MSEHNDAIHDFLQHYYQLPFPPQYAVLVKGKWGSGKTWFVQESLKRLKASGGRGLYVSLYGLSSFQHIEDELFRRLHPVMGSKGMGLASRVVKGFVKGTLRLDWDGDGRDDGTATVGIPDLNLPEYLRNTAGLILVFDDVERCSIPINNLLGYINHFVEHDGQKVVLVANEDEILDLEDTKDPGKAYRRIKEKLIGKTFEVEPELDSAVDVFVKEIGSTAAHDILARNRPLIRDLYTASAYRNLRHLRQALLDYARLVDALDEGARHHDELVAELLTTFLVYSFEIKSGAMQPSDLLRLMDGFIKAFNSRDEDDSNDPYARLVAKHAGFSPLDSSFPVELWERFFSTGLLDAAGIQKAVRNSPYFASTEQPDWARLWHAYDLRDEEVETLLATVSTRFDRREYGDILAVRHVAGLLLHFADIGLYPVPKAEILQAAFANVDALKAGGQLNSPADAAFGDWDSGGGLGFFAKDTPEFKRLTEHIKQRTAEAAEERYPAQAEELLGLMGDDIGKFCRSLIPGSHEDSRYAWTPILRYMNADAFVQTLSELSAHDTRRVTHTLEKRYQGGRRELIPEAEWLEAVATRLSEVEVERTGKMSGVVLGFARETISEAENRLKKLQEYPAA